jgi:glycine hydroxymethyltransferase
MTLARRSWVPAPSEDLVQTIAGPIADQDAATLIARIEALAEKNREIHERDCFNLNPAANVMNPRAEALLSSRLGSRPSLGYPGDKYEMGLEAIEEIEVIAAELAAEVFDARFRRDPRGLGRHGEPLCLHGDLQTRRHDHRAARLHRRACHPPRAGLRGALRAAHPARAGGGGWLHGRHRRAGVLARSERPRLITIGGSLNLDEHPVAELRAIADEVGATLLFDAAHQCGIIAGRAWKNPLTEGAHLMTMSTYKSLGGPAGGLIVTNDAGLAERLDAIAFPGMTANFDAAKSAALAVTMLDWRDFGRAYAAEMVAMARALAEAMIAEGLPVYRPERLTHSHQFALEAAPFGGGQAASKAPAPRGVSRLGHRPAPAGGSGRRQRHPPRHAGAGALGHDTGRRAAPRPPDRHGAALRRSRNARTRGRGMARDLRQGAFRPRLMRPARRVKRTDDSRSSPRPHRHVTVFRPGRSAPRPRSCRPTA